MRTFRKMSSHSERKQSWMDSACRSRDRLPSLGLASGNTMRRMGGSAGIASIIGTKMKVHPRFAALANGISIHADDYDDTGSAVHVAAPVLPPAFALCESGHRTGKDLMLAFHVGVEVENKIGEAMPPRH